MPTGRFEVDEGDKGLMIYDHEGVDDYYFVNDKEELQQFCDLINNEREQKILILEQTIKNLKKENEELKQLLTKDKTIDKILPALHTELKDILHEECEKYWEIKDNDAVATLNKLAYDLGIIENKEIL